jgi:mannose/fructose-specific phosphotransferase system component IIA
LEQAGFIVRNAGINGERAGDRQDGIVVWAAGINLAPLVERFAEMQAKAEALELQARAIQQCRAEIRQLGQRIREAGDDDLRERAETILPDGRTARITNIDRLIAIREALSAMLAAIESAPDPDPRALKTSDAPEENCAPNIQDKTHHEGVPRRSRSARAHPARDRAGGGHRELSRHRRGAGRADLAQPCRGVVAQLRSAWHRPEHLGPGLPAVRAGTGGAQRVADRPECRIAAGPSLSGGSPARCLAGMVRRAGSAGVNLAGLFRATERNAQQAPSQSPAPEQAIEPQLALWPI